MSKILKFSFAVLTACLTIGSLSSFTTLDASYWYYNEALGSNFNDPGNWQKNPVEGVSCGAGEQIPCRTNDQLTEEQLETMLASNPGTNLFDEVSERAIQ